MPYAIAFDMQTDKLKKYYGEPYNNAYEEVKRELDTFGFEWTQGSLYVEKKGSNNLANIYQAIQKLSSINWFRKSVRDIRAFKVEDWSNFTNIVKKSRC